MSKPCAFCGIERKTTREHIWPKSILERTEYKIRYSDKAGKIISGDLTIKDVCAVCNNGPLSMLDAYATVLYDIHFGKFERAWEPITFNYDFGKLTRWLLKISYNASRGYDTDSALLARYADAIISEYDCSPTHVAIFCGRIKPSRKNNGELIKPMGARCGRSTVAEGQYDQWCATRLIVLNSYVFNMIIVKDTSADQEHLLPLFRQLYGTVLRPAGSIVIPTPTMDTLQAFGSTRDWPRGK